MSEGLQEQIQGLCENYLGRKFNATDIKLMRKFLSDLQRQNLEEEVEKDTKSEIVTVPLPFSPLPLPPSSSHFRFSLFVALLKLICIGNLRVVACDVSSLRAPFSPLPPVLFTAMCQHCP